MGPILRAALIRSAFGPERTFVDGAANDSSEPRLPDCRIAAKVFFRELKILYL